MLGDRIPEVKEEPSAVKPAAGDTEQNTSACLVAKGTAPRTPASNNIGYFSKEPIRVKERANKTKQDV